MAAQATPLAAAGAAMCSGCPVAALLARVRGVQKGGCLGSPPCIKAAYRLIITERLQVIFIQVA
jgi:hypothetical protein